MSTIRSSLAPDLFTALLAQTQASTVLAAMKAAVLFGVGTAPGDPRHVIRYGSTDPAAPINQPAVQATRLSMPNLSREREENGTLAGVAESWNGQGDELRAVLDVYAMCDEVARICHDAIGPGVGNNVLGIAGLMGLAFAGHSAYVGRDPNNGAVAMVPFLITYKARI